MNYYTGIGARKTPKEICEKMTEIATILESMNYILRSGGANGADKAFEDGVLNNHKRNMKEIYLPWKGFNDNPSIFISPTEEAFEIASTIHPAWDKLSFGAKKLHARNVHQVLGMDCKTPSQFLVCWTEDAKIKGGTATAINLAKGNDILVCNLASDLFVNESALTIVTYLTTTFGLF